ncbi:MAG: hypothetical protein EBY16_05820 [Gammaproteobacteria bacterium]|nr:hypothetical protein [Gammaproteobacteria bacterium]
MSTVYQILALVMIGLAIWWLYRTVKNQPQMFSKDNLNKSIYSLGILALVLIVFVAFLVMLVRS